MKISSSHFPVIIVGAGPTGLTLANMLGQYGLRFALIERNDGTVDEPRAVSIDDESLRTMQAAGVVETVLREIVPGYGSIYYSSSRAAFAKVEPTGTPYGYPRRNAFRQPVLEQQMLAALASHSHATTLFGWALNDFDQTEQRVQVQLKSTDGRTQMLSCDYLIGCDGASSTIRARLGIMLEGTTYMRRWLILDLENCENTTKHTEVYCDPRRPCITLPGPDRTRRYEFELFPDETDEEMLAPKRILELLSTYRADPKAIIRRQTVYRFHARVAPRWSVGRVYLAGDAAHLTPPFAGQGMNSCVRDAHNLAWKVAAVASGALGPGLLETYQQERRDHVWQMVRLALRMGRIMSPRNRTVALLTQAAFSLLNLCPPARDYITQMKYKPKPRFSTGFMVPDGRSGSHTLVGRLLPQPTVIMSDGQSVLLDDVLGRGFALVVRTARPEATFGALDQPIWDQLGASRVAVLPQGSPPRHLPHVVCVAERDEDFRTALGRDQDSVILLRPDRYVAACFPLAEAVNAARAVEELQRQTWEHSGAMMTPADIEEAPLL